MRVTDGDSDVAALGGGGRVTDSDSDVAATPVNRSKGTWKSLRQTDRPTDYLELGPGTTVLWFTRTSNHFQKGAPLLT